jgi:hypothetical protein
MQPQQVFVLLHIKDVPLITATIHDPSLLLPLCQDNSAITTATHTQNLLLLCVQDDTAITMATHTNFKLQLIVGSSHKALIKLIVKFISNPKSPFLLHNEDNSEIMTPSLLLFCIKDASSNYDSASCQLLTSVVCCYFLQNLLPLL